MVIRGMCHCRNLGFALRWEPDPTAIAARACACSFCTRHGAVWTATPQGALVLELADPAQVSRYTFGTGTATFLTCARCGVVPAVTSRIDGRLYAAVNVTTFDGVDPELVRTAPAHFDGEDTATRLARRQRGWIPDVTFAHPGRAAATLAAVAVELTTAPTDEVRLLIGELEENLAAGYPPEQRHALSLDAIFQPHIRFFVARAGGEAIGCGGVALFPDFAEVKRMYVRPAARGSGAAHAILAHVEEAARAGGATVLRLETGDRQHAAMRFYQGAGFRPCGVFGAYATMTPHAIATSRFFEKSLAI